jgi:transposase
VPPRKRIDLSADVREALEEDLALSYEAYQRNAEEFKMKLAVLNTAGLTVQEISDVIGVGKSTVGDWKRQGEEARNRRRGIRPGGPGE